MIYDPVRRKQVAFLPEEQVRQSLIHYLIQEIAVPIQLISVEYGLTGIEKGNTKRVDVLVWKPGAGQLVPWLLAECKAPSVKLNDKWIDQMGGYLVTVACPFLMATNGSYTRVLERQGDKYCPIPSLPRFK